MYSCAHLGPVFLVLCASMLLLASTIDVGQTLSNESARSSGRAKDDIFNGRRSMQPRSINPRKMRSIAACSQVLCLALLVFPAQLQAFGICDWDERTFTTEKDQITFRTVIPDDYRDGYIGKNAFWYDEDLGNCVLGSTAFSCHVNEIQGITVTDIMVFNVTNVDNINLNSSFPVTIHRIEEYVRDKKVEDRFIVEETMGLSQCPKYKQTRLVWKFPGTVLQRTAFECFQGRTKLCRGVTTTNEFDKCVVTIEGTNLIHTRIVNASKTGVEFFYCHLDPATPHHAQTYNVDWRNALEIPPGGISPNEMIEVAQPKYDLAYIADNYGLGLEEIPPGIILPEENTEVTPSTLDLANTAEKHLTAMRLASFMTVLAGVAAGF